MTSSEDRLEELLEGTKRKRRTLVSPEGVTLNIRAAGHGERITAFTLDIVFMFTAIICLYLLILAVFFTGSNISVGMTLLLFLAFLVRNLYFLHFELAWQGRTPGKRICGLRVINRSGGELAPSALIARNLTREVEFFLPLSLFFSLNAEQNAWQQLALLGWTLSLTALPFFNREHLRAGDLIGGTQVIAMPKRMLLDDLTGRPVGAQSPAYAFTAEQLAIYGTFELQVLEEFLRRPPSPETERLLEEVCRKIITKIGWEGNVSAGSARRFLTEFYAAERADLERGQLFGKIKADKTSAAAPPSRGPHTESAK